MSKKRPDAGMKKLIKENLIKWRREPVIKKLDKPTRLDKARSIGYKAKKGFIIVRTKVSRGGRRRHLYGRRGRKPSKSGLIKFTLSKPLNWVAEMRSAKKYPNLEILGSYYVGMDGRYKWFEVIMVDPERPEIKKDKNISWITKRQHRGRVFRGLT
jgi:large subunit ribosomal protein L15e